MKIRKKKGTPSGGLRNSLPAALRPAVGQGRRRQELDVFYFILIFFFSRRQPQAHFLLHFVFGEKEMVAPGKDGKKIRNKKHELRASSASP